MEEGQQLRSDQAYFPVRVNDPKMIVFWDVTEVRPIMIALAFGVLMDQANIALILGIVAFILTRKLNAKFAKGFLSHLMWWHGLLPMAPTCSMPDPYLREIYR